MSRPGASGSPWVLTVVGGIASLLIAVLGVSLVARGTTATVVTGSLMLTIGVAGVLSAVGRVQLVRETRTVERSERLLPRPAQVDGEAATLHPRTLRPSGVMGHVVLVLLGLWALAMIGWALLRGAPAWLVLLVPWAVLVLGGPVLALTGRLAPGGVYVTPTRVVDVDRGGRSEIALADVELVAPTVGRLLLRPARPGALLTRRTGGMWGRRPRTDLVVIDTTGLYGGSELLGERVRGALPR